MREMIRRRREAKRQRKRYEARQARRAAKRDARRSPQRPPLPEARPKRAFPSLSRRSILVSVATICAVVLSAVAVSHQMNGWRSAIKVYDYTLRAHVENAITYQEKPAVAGAHNPQWQRCGFYVAAVNDSYAVHSMERGAVWITYRAKSLSGADVVTLEQLTVTNPFVLVSPYETQDAPVVVTAWNHQLKLPSVSDSRLMKFVKSFVKGAQAPERYLGCQGGVDTSLLTPVATPSPSPTPTPKASKQSSSAK